MYPPIKFVGRFEPTYANLITQAHETALRPGDVYIKRVDDWLCVFKRTRDGKIRKGQYKSMIDAVAGARYK